VTCDSSCVAWAANDNIVLRLLQAAAAAVACCCLFCQFANGVAWSSDSWVIIMASMSISVSLLAAAVCPLLRLLLFVLPVCQ
jgi:hypothetical protein